MVKLPRYLATKFHNWHNGMDAVYAVGSQISAGIDLNLNSVIDAKCLLKVDLECGEFTGENDVKELELLISLLDAVISGNYQYLLERDLAYYALVYLFYNELENHPDYELVQELHGQWLRGELLDSFPELLCDCGDLDVEDYLPIEKTKELIAKMKIEYPNVDFIKTYLDENNELYDMWMYVLDDYGYQIDVYSLVEKVVNSCKGESK